MSEWQLRILEWLDSDDTGMSSKTIALAALGATPKRISYPSDSNDFGRCYRLLKMCPEAKSGVDRLAKEGGKVWAALALRWPEIEAAYLSDEKHLARQGRKYNDYSGLACYDLMKSILNPIEDASGRIVRIGDRASVHFGKDKL